MFNLPSLASNPAVKSSESPGRKKPISRPVSAKTIAITAISPNGDIDSIRFFGSRKPPAARAAARVCSTHGTVDPLPSVLDLSGT